MAEVKRLNYFNGQFLVEKDFQDEQKYEVDMRRRLNAGLHSWGVAGGLTVTKSGDKQVTVAAGLAVNRDGAEIVLSAPQTVDLTPFGANAVVFLTAAYREVFDPRRSLHLGRPGQLHTHHGAPAPGGEDRVAARRRHGGATGEDCAGRRRQRASTD